MLQAGDLLKSPNVGVGHSTFVQLKGHVFTENHPTWILADFIRLPMNISVDHNPPSNPIPIDLITSVTKRKISGTKIHQKYTPPKFNMEPKKKSPDKKIPFGNHHFQVPPYKISGVLRK